jgi:protein TonB
MRLGRAERAARAMAKRSETYRSRLDHDPTAMGFSVLLSCLLSCLVTFLLFPPTHRDEKVEESLKRFGYEGATRYEREIEVRLSDQAPLVLGQNRLVGALPRTSEKVAGTPVPEDPHAHRKGHKSDFPGLAGLTESGTDARHLRHLNLPMVQSEDLIIVELVRPEYPRQAVAQGVAGRVELLALVNVSGAVDDIEIVQSAGGLLDDAASQAVRRCRFLPYRVNGEAQPVYADFHFNFTLLDN